MRRLSLCHLPTPIWRNDALDRLLGFELWVKRDDATSGASAGNKLRKLEYLLADALDRGATTVVTCGGQQSNHARATALSARELGLRPVLMLRTEDPAVPPSPTGNLFLNHLAGAELRFITPAQYRDRQRLLADLGRELTSRGERPYLIPEGGSNGLGARGYAMAVAELAEQQRAGQLPSDLDLVAVACGSGGTAAGLALGLGRFPGVARRVAAFAVCDDRAYFEASIAGICREALSNDAGSAPPGPLDVIDDFKGPGYGVASKEQLEFMVAVTRACGLVLDPTYTGKALFGLSRCSPRPHRALFVHTGGLPGALVASELMAAASVLDAAAP